MECSRYEYRDFVLREVAYPAGLQLPRHDHPYTNVTAVLRGEMLEETPGAEHRGRSCSVVVKPAYTAHANRALGPGPVVTIAIELRQSSELAKQVRDLRWSWLENAETTRSALALQRSILSGSAGEIESRAEHLLAAALTPLSPADPPPWLAHVLTILQTQSHHSPRFDAIARDLGLHAAYISRAFRRFTGKSMTEYVRDVRLGDVRHLLSSTKRPLSLIATDCGFTDASHLSRTFGRLYAVSPGTYRQICNSRG